MVLFIHYTLNSWTGSESTVLCMTTFRPLSSIGGAGSGAGNGILAARSPANPGQVAPHSLPTILDVETCYALSSRRDSGVLVEEDSPYDSSNNSGSNVGVSMPGRVGMAVGKTGGVAGGVAGGWAEKVREAGGRARLAAQAMGAIGAGMLPVPQTTRNPYDRANAT